jgi:hypothetical protein
VPEAAKVTIFDEPDGKITPPRRLRRRTLAVAPRTADAFRSAVDSVSAVPGLPGVSRSASLEEEVAMARKSSAWTQVQRQREERARAAASRERANQQAMRQILRDRDQAQRRADRADAADRRREQHEVYEAGAAAAKAMKTEVDARVAELQAILSSALPVPPRLSYAMLRRSASVPSFDPGRLGDPLPLLRWEDFEPSPPGGLATLVGGRVRHARVLENSPGGFRALSRGAGAG